MLRELLETIVKAIVDYPDEVIINENPTERRLIFELKVNKSDIGKVIGRGGKTIRAIRLLLNVAGAKEKQRAGLEIIEEN